MASRAPAAQQRRRVEIVDAGTSLIGGKGYGRTTMDDIASAAGVTKRTLYRYVPAKQDILPMIHERFQGEADALISDDAGAEQREQPAGWASALMFALLAIVAWGFTETRGGPARRPRRRVTMVEFGRPRVAEKLFGQAHIPATRTAGGFHR